MIFLALCSCEQKRTEVVLGLITDLAAPGAIDAVDLQIFRDDVPYFQLPDPFTIPGAAGGKYELPASFGIYTEDGSEPRIEVQVTGLRNGTTVVKRSAVFAPLKERTLFMRMALASSCKTLGNCPRAD